MSADTFSLDLLKAALEGEDEAPYYAGTVALEGDAATLSYQSGKSSLTSINFARVRNAHLKTLADACQPATFGMDNKDVLDESYRKAGKMDANKISVQFSPQELGIVDCIRESLLRGQNANKDIQVELYKLNVYGPGAFFKSHVDTPRSGNMFGSLVVILPTVHEGGSLVFRNRGREWKFDSAKAVSLEPTPQAAFVAFFSDIEHEVSAVISGYRVTLTYNLYFADQPSTTTATTNSRSSVSSVATNDYAKLLAALSMALNNPNFLPDGGLLGFGLSHRYPFKPNSVMNILNPTEMSDTIQRLKGRDDTVKRVCDALSLKSSLKTLYRDHHEDAVSCLMDRFIYFGDDEIDGGLMDNLQQECGGMLVYEIEDGPPDSEYFTDVKPIIWAHLTDNNRFTSKYIAYGNEASVDYVYGEVCLVADIPPTTERKAG